MRIIARILSIILIITIPVVALCVGINVATRLPDVYQYEFKATDTLERMDLELTNDEMGEFISDFMVGKGDTFQLWTGDEEKPQALFTEEEMAAMNQLRHYINITAIVGFVLIIPLMVCFIMLKRKELNVELRRYYGGGLVGYVILLAIIGILKMMVFSGNYTIWDLTDYVLKTENTDMLPQLITESLVRNISMVAVAISAFFMGVIGYTTYKITAPRRIFSRN